MNGEELYRLLFDEVRIDACADGTSQVPRFAKLLRWCSSLGCVIQACDQAITAPLRSYCVTRPSLFLSVTLSAGWKDGEPETNLPDVPHANNMVLAIAIREPTLWTGTTPCCDRLRSVGIAVPAESLVSLGLGDHFEDLFEDAGAPLAVRALPLTAKIRSLAEDMLAPPQDGPIRQLLIDAHATEIVARTFEMLGTDCHEAELRDRDRIAVGRVRDLIESDLAREWALTDLARIAGLGARSLNAKFRAAYGTTVFEFLKRRRFEYAHEALASGRLSVSEIAYQVGYESPANFTTAFRRHFGYVPSTLRRSRWN